MFNGFESDRRQGYSLVAHVRRIIATKGFSRVALSLGGTAIIAAIAFAHCSSSSITGPKSSAPAATPGGITPGGTQKDLFSPSKFGPIRSPMTVLPDNSPCTGQPILWDPTKQFTMTQGTTQSGTDATLHVQMHLNSQAQGVTSPAVAATVDPLNYVGSEEYNSQQIVFVTGTEKYKLEWNMKIIAKGNDGTLFPEDDFMMHIVANVPLDPTQMDVTGTSYCQ
jgi:hypothetical protein